MNKPVKLSVRTVKDIHGTPIGFVGGLVSEAGAVVAESGIVRTAGLAASDARSDAQALAVMLRLEAS